MYLHIIPKKPTDFYTVSDAFVGIVLFKDDYAHCSNVWYGFSLDNKISNLLYGTEYIPPPLLTAVSSTSSSV